MKRQYYIVIAVALIILIGSFYWYEIKPTNARKNCYMSAEEEKQTAITADNNALINGIELTKRADYDKIFNDEYKNCLLKSGIEE